MNRYILPIALFFLFLHISSCKDDEVPPAIISFIAASSTIAETQETASIIITLDKAAPGDIVVNYTIEGSAAAGEDFESSGSLTIANGAIEGELVISIIDDLVFESDPLLTKYYGELLNITLSGITGNGKLSETQEDIKHSLAILDNDPAPKSLTIELSWDSGNGTPGDVDMDLHMFLLDPEKGPQFLTGSTTIGTDFEGIVVTSPAPDAVYGLAYRYFEGSSDNLTFKVKFIVENGTLTGGLTDKTFTAVYTKANINGDVSQNASVQIVQSFEKTGSNYTAFSEIQIPDSGSRGKRIQGAVFGRGN